MSSLIPSFSEPKAQTILAVAELLIVPYLQDTRDVIRN